MPRELAAATASESAGSTVASSAISTPMLEQTQAKKAEMVASAPADNSWSNMLGLWAWKQDTNKGGAPVAKSVEEVKGRP
jgi:hypothetical protein